MYFDNGTHRIYYEEEGSGEPLLLLPGFTLSIDDMASIRKALASRCRVIAADLPGSGQSEPQPRTYSMTYHEEDARLFLALLRELDASPAHVVGFSDGGDYALVMAELEPAAVCSVVAWGAAGTLGTSMEPVEAFRSVLESPPPPLEPYSRYLRESYGETTARAIIDSAADAWTAIIAAGGDISRGRADEIACPVLLVTGEHDFLASPALVSEMAAAIPRGEFIEAKGAGHGVHHEQPEWLAETVVEWLSRLEGQAVGGGQGATDATGATDGAKASSLHVSTLTLDGAGVMTDAMLDEAKVATFAGQMVGVMNHASLALMASIGHQVGLFDRMAALAPSTSEEIAEAARLNERYVREWLGAMVAGGVVEYDAVAKQYRLPAEHAASLTRAAGPGNLAAATQLIPMLAAVEELIVDCFRNGGGVPYSAYKRFQRWMAEDSASLHDVSLIETILPLVQGLTARLAAGIDVCDIGCGSGHAVNLMARAFPRSRFAGYDLSEEGIAAARAEAVNWGLANAEFEIRDVTALAMTERFDLVTAFDAIHDQAHPAQVLAGIARALRPGGTFLMVDIRASSLLEENLNLPLATMLYTVSTMHCMSVSLAQGGVGLGTVWGEQLAHQMLADAGFRRVEVKAVEGDIFNSYFAAAKG